MCSKCFDELEFLPAEVNRKVFKSEVYCAGVYDKNLQKLIRGLKYHRQSDLAYYQAKFMWQYWQRLDLLEDDFQIVPVPIFAKRKKQRKYNHMDLVADEFSLLTGFVVKKDFLLRVKDTQKQFKLKKYERIQNIRNAFDLNIEKAPNIDSNILLIDDITSTGITLDEIIKCLKKRGYKNITALTLATPDIWN